MVIEGTRSRLWRTRDKYGCVREGKLLEPEELVCEPFSIAYLYMILALKCSKLL